VPLTQQRLERVDLAARQVINGARWIASIALSFGDDQEIATISAIVRDGRVRALKLWVGAAGG
jgi:hypothetical protein